MQKAAMSTALGKRRKGMGSFGYKSRHVNRAKDKSFGQAFWLRTQTLDQKQRSLLLGQEAYK
eukprot:1228225-Amphidinium_carterae.1